MESYLISSHFDLVSPDGYIEKIKKRNKNSLEAILVIKNISPAFLGFHLETRNIFFNVKSTLAQLGIDGKAIEIDISRKKRNCEVSIILNAIGPIAEKFLNLLEKNSYVGKLFVIDEKRKVRNPNYLMRMLGRCDRNGSPLLSLGSINARDHLILKKIKDHTIAFLPLKKGIISYEKEIYNLLPSLAKMLKYKKFKIREMLKLHQVSEEKKSKTPSKNNILLVRTEPLHVRTVFAKVAEEFLPKGFIHTSACVLEPNTEASGNIYELYGNSDLEIEEIPLEFYTLEPHREYVFFSDRDQLQNYLEKPNALIKAYKTAPKPKEVQAAVFVVKGTQLEKLQENDWIKKTIEKNKFPGLNHPSRQAFLVEKYIQQQPSYPFLKAIENGLITSQGILLTRYFPSPVMKKMLINTQVQRCLKGIYFQNPSKSFDIFFSHEDRSFLLDLAKFAIPVFWVEEKSKQILKYVVRIDKESGMFVPLKLEETFRNSCFFGIYGSNLLETNFKEELKNLFKELLKLKKESEHPLLNKNTPLAIVTGGGPGVMEIGNKIAKELSILSCANIVDFKSKNKFINEQKINPYIDAKMTYRIDRLVERQSEFYLDFPIFLPGGIGTDFEYTIEEVRRKIGSVNITPILLFGKKEYWKEKISSRFKNNLKNKTIKGSEWTSNCFYSVETYQDALSLYKKFLQNKLAIGRNGPIYEDGFLHYQKP